LCNSQSPSEPALLAPSNVTPLDPSIVALLSLQTLPSLKPTMVLLLFPLRWTYALVLPSSPAIVLLSSRKISHTGRSKDTIVLINGKNISPQPIEDMVRA